MPFRPTPRASAALAALALALGVAGAPGPAAAHPHIFVEAEVAIVFDDAGQVAGVQLVWVYDDFFSFLLTADLGIDMQGTLTLTPEEHQILADNVLQWPADFGGDLVVMQDGRPLALAAPQQQRVDYVNGRVHEIHVRPLRQPADPSRPVDVQVYDPYYYVAYEVVGDIGLIGRAGCEIRYTPADLMSAYALVEELLFGRPAYDVGPDEDFPAVGDAFADTVTVQCAP